MLNEIDYTRVNKKIEIMTTPDIFITQKSTPHEVRNWIKAKGFSQRVSDQTKGFNGEKIFKMHDRNGLIKAFGHDEGTRLYSQITISRNSADYKTARSSELRKALARARKKADRKIAEQHERADDDDDDSRSDDDDDDSSYTDSDSDSD